MGPIEHAVFQIGVKVEEKFYDLEFGELIRNLASYISEVEAAPDDWKSNKNIKKIQEISDKISKS